MRVAYVCADPGVPVFGRKGCSVHVQEVLHALSELGAEVELFAARTGGAPPADLAHVPLHVLPATEADDLASREGALLACNAALAALLAQHGPFDLVYERYALWSFAAMEYARQSGMPGVLEVNAPLIDEQARHRGLVDRAGAERATQRAFASAAAIIAVSAEVASYVGSFPATAGRIHVLPNGVRESRFPADLAPLPRRDGGTFVVGFLGSLKPWHGLDTLVRAFALLYLSDPTYRLSIVGDGPQRQHLEAELAARGLLSAAELAGAANPDEVPALLATMDVAVAPYPPLADFYFSPLKVVEYMAAGRPIVASRIGQLQSLLEHERTALLYAAGDEAALADCIQRLRHDDSLRRQLGEEARRHVLRSHTWHSVVMRVLEIAGLNAAAGGLLV